MKATDLKRIIREEVQAVMGMNEAASMTLPDGFYVFRNSGMTPEEGGAGEYLYGVSFFASERNRLRVSDVEKIANSVMKVAKQVATAINGSVEEGMESLGGNDKKNIKIGRSQRPDKEVGVSFTAYVYSKMSPKEVKKAIKGAGAKDIQ